MPESVVPYSLGTFMSATRPAFAALVVGDRAYAIEELRLHGSGALLPAERPSMLDVFACWNDIGPQLDIAAARRAAGPRTDGVLLDTLQTLVPFRPRQIICAGANYRKHVIDILVDHPGSGSDPAWSLDERRRRAERIMDHRAAVGQPFAFVKAVSAVLDPFANLAIPADSTETDWELELGVVIGRSARRVSRERAFEHVAGYVICNDITARDHISRLDIPSLGLDFLAGKSGPGFLPLGPLVVPAQFVPNPQDLMLTLRLNGAIMQHESTSNMIYPIAKLIEFISTHVQLLPGDLICTGSPSGNGTHHQRFLRPGDLMEGSIEKLGTQRNLCVAEVLPENAALHRPFIPLDMP